MMKVRENLGCDCEGGSATWWAIMKACHRAITHRQKIEDYISTALWVELGVAVVGRGAIWEESDDAWGICVSS